MHITSNINVCLLVCRHSLRNGRLFAFEQFAGVLTQFRMLHSAEPLFHLTMRTRVGYGFFFEFPSFTRLNCYKHGISLNEIEQVIWFFTNPLLMYDIEETIRKITAHVYRA